ncbi:hypothetical protein CDCA_CDCA08G2346 [Cyanidium caldarium]|uniref:Uncharacterized protein n=1 Tax=Cyanidium caldarium TaxID=2771 RepID=A0AAV9IW88_CYACA|nr:hypothetical protein CDCA_CDCA08G2346 [Cyanidium caldarium]|eukprot:ctg_178.g133
MDAPLPDPLEVEGYVVRVSEALVARLNQVAAPESARTPINFTLRPQTGREQRLVEQTLQRERRKRTELVRRVQTHWRLLEERRAAQVSEAVERQLGEWQQRDYQAPLRTRPLFCEAERQALIQCYQTERDVLDCAQLITALEQCAARAEQTALQESSAPARTEPVAKSPA